jgi:hypothetical protein
MLGPLRIIRAAASGLKGLVAPQRDSNKDAVFATTATITVVDPNATKASEALAKAALGNAFPELPAAPAKPLATPAAPSAEHKTELKTEVKEELKTEEKAEIKPELAAEVELKAQPVPAKKLGGDIEAKASKVSYNAGFECAHGRPRVPYCASHYLAAASCHCCNTGPQQAVLQIVHSACTGM